MGSGNSAIDGTPCGGPQVPQRGRATNQRPVYTSSLCTGPRGVSWACCALPRLTAVPPSLGPLSSHAVQEDLPNQASTPREVSHFRRKKNLPSPQCPLLSDLWNESPLSRTPFPHPHSGLHPPTWLPPKTSQNTHMSL